MECAIPGMGIGYSSTNVSVLWYTHIFITDALGGNAFEVARAKQEGFLQEVASKGLSHIQ